MPVEQVNRAAVTVRHTKVINQRTFLVSLIVHPNNLGVETYRSPRVFGDKFGDKFGEQFGDSLNFVINLVILLVTYFVSHQVCHNFW